MVKDTGLAQDIGRRIAQARHEAGGMTQRELGDLIGVTERSIAAYEAGKVIPYRFMKALEEALNVDASWLLHGEEARHQESQRLDEIVTLLRELKAALLER